MNTWHNVLRKLPPWITPNRITVGRATMFVPMAVLLLLEENVWAFTIFIVSALLDRVDGDLARARGQCENGMSELGAMMDPLADKAFFAGSVFLLIPILDYSQSPWWLPLTLGLACGFLALVEIWLVITRWQDYIHNRENPTTKRDLRATWSGKIKFLLELIGIGGLVVAFPDPTCTTAWIGGTSLLAATPFAWVSLRGKLRRR